MNFRAAIIYVPIYRRFATGCSGLMCEVPQSGLRRSYTTGGGGGPGRRGRQRVGDTRRVTVRVVGVPGGLPGPVLRRGLLAEGVIHEAGGAGSVGHPGLDAVGVVSVGDRSSVRAVRRQARAWPGMAAGRRSRHR